MSEFRARISRVRMKHGGADMRVFKGLASARLTEELTEATLLRAAREIVSEGPVAAFVIVAFNPEGRTAFNWRFTQDSPIPRTLLPSYVEELIRRFVVTREEASQRFDEMFQWVEK